MNLYGLRRNGQKVLIEESRFVLDGFSVSEFALRGLNFDVEYSGLDVVSITPVRGDEGQFAEIDTARWVREIRSHVESMLRKAVKEEVPVFLGIETIEKYDVESGILTIKDL